MLGAIAGIILVGLIVLATVGLFIRFIQLMIGCGAIALIAVAIYHFASAHPWVL